MEHEALLSFIDGFIKGTGERVDNIEAQLNEIIKKQEDISNRIYIGTEIQGYIITVISHNHCIAERINKVNCDDFVVWSIDNDRKGVSIGRYFSSWNSALQKFISLIAYERGILRSDEL